MIILDSNYLKPISPPLFIKMLSHRYVENYNLFHKHIFLTYVSIKTSSGNVVNVRRRKVDKLAALQKCVKSGGIEILPAVCKNCEMKCREVVLKSPTNPHYGCYEDCCPMLHQWDLCACCIETKYFPCEVDDPKRITDSERFQRVFSRLPDDIQRVVEEYVPQVFAFVKSSGLIRSFDKIQRGVRLPSAIWNQVREEMEMQNIHNPEGGYTLKRLSREKLLQILRGEYKALYMVCRSHVIDDEDFWSHRKWSCMFVQDNIANMFSKVSAIIGSPM